jgi:dipeptidyl aminopeptidase/acylaminoacyl peptidase
VHVRRLGPGRHVTLLVLAAALAPSACGSQTTVEDHLVFTRERSPARSTIWIADADGRHGRRLTRGYWAAISPDGRTVAVGRDDGIHLVGSDGRGDRLLLPVKMGPEAWSPDGRWLIADTERQLVAIDTRSGHRGLVVRGPTVGFDFDPDGHRVVYALARVSARVTCGVSSDLYTVEPSGGNRVRLTRDGRSSYPVWGRDGIAFMRLPQSKGSDCPGSGIWTIRPDGSGLRPVFAQPPRALSRNGYYGLQPVAWLPSDELLVGVRSEWGDEPARLDMRGRLRRLTWPTATYYVDKASRDGRLALGAGGDDKLTIAIVRVSDGRPLFSLSGDVCCPDWNR